MSEYQLALPGITPPLAGARREPYQRKGESWRSYCIRHETWRRVTRREKSPAENAAAIESNRAFREKVAVSCKRLAEGRLAKLYENPPLDAVFFWFGRIGSPGANAQYVNEAGLKYLVSKREQMMDVRRRYISSIIFGNCGDK